MFINETVREQASLLAGWLEDRDVRHAIFKYVVE